MNCFDCGISINDNHLTRFKFKEFQPVQPLAASTREFGTDHLDLNKPVCAKCAGIYKESYIEKKIKLAIKQLDEK